MVGGGTLINQDVDFIIIISKIYFILCLTLFLKSTENSGIALKFL